MASRVKARWFDKDRGWKKLMAEIKRASMAGPVVAVGIFGDKGQESQPDGSGIPTVTVAQINEFGVGVPERPFIRGTVDARKKDIHREQRRLALGILDGKLNTTRALNLLGIFVKAQMRDYIVAHIPPPNAPTTIAKKGSATPLIDTGHMMNAIDHEVRKPK